ncbi:MAG TPA: hypothetical protein VGP32_11970 [Steroidobacteraceae bacterium]|jgi:hypothetical protein|nr:hypothetical protein [Steroidobacteraceae bacterium]
MKTLTPWRRVHGACLGTILLAAGAAASAQQQQGATTQYGELAFGARQYYPQGCTHSGNTAVCSFVFVQQAQTQPIRIGWGGELSGIQFVDDSHVPHNPSAAYFVDNYGARQMNMTVNRGDQGTMMVEFAQVDPQVASGSFTLGQQVISGIPVDQGGGAQLGGANALAGMGGAPAGAALPARPGAPALAAPNTLSANNTHLAAAPQASQGAPQANQAAPGCNTPQTINTPACKLNTKINNAQTNATNTLGAVAAPVSAVQQLGSSISSLFKKPAPAPAPAPAAVPVQQPTSQ